MNILDAVEKHGLAMKRVGKTGKRGEEFAGPCPACGGDDRFRVMPANGDKGGTFFCRSCGIKGDAIKFMRDFIVMSFADAAREVGMQVKGRQTRSPAPILKAQQHNEESAGGNYPYPPQGWRDKAEAFLQHLRGSAGNIDRAVRYLATRGISAEAAERFGLVWNTQQYFRVLSVWGLKDEDKGGGRLAKIYLPDGLVIPYRADCGIIRLRVRRESGDPRYLAIKGSSVEPLLITGHERCLVVVEAELDAILIASRAGDLVSVMATGSTTVRPSSLQIAEVHQFPLILLAFDNDAPGEHACQWWLREFPQAKRFAPAAGKDPGEHPSLVRQWIAERVPWGASADFLKKKKEGEGAKKGFTVPWKCRGCWAQWPPEAGEMGEQCINFGGYLPIEQVHEACTYE